MEGPPYGCKVSALFAGRYLGGRPVCIDRHWLHDGVRHPAPDQLCPRRYLYRSRFSDGVRYCFPSADHFHPVGGGGNGTAGHRSGKDRLQAPAHCAAHVGNDLRDRYVLPFAELDVVCHRRSGQAVPCPAVDQRHRHGAGLPDQAGDGGNAIPRHCAGGSTCYPDPEDQDRHGHARRFPRF